MDTTVIKVGMNCKHCKMSVEKALMNLDGISKAEADLVKQNVTVTFDPGRVNLEAMKNAITEAGYTAG